MSDKLDTAIGGLGVVLLNVMLVVGILQVMARYVDLPFGTYWTGEISRTMLAFMTILALPYLFRNDADISFLPILERVVSRLDALLFFRNVLLSALSVILIWSSYKAYETAGTIGLPTLQWFKLRWAFVLLGLSFAALLLVVLLDTRNRIHGIRKDSGVESILGDSDV